MGCDIHLYIEYKSQYGWIQFGDRFNPGRNYGIFAFLAGVRNYDDVKGFELKGLPNDITYEVNRENQLYIVEGEKDHTEGTCLRTSAERWVEAGISEYSEDKKFVTHPDWHSHSWLSLEEYNKVLELYAERYFEYDIYVEYKIIQGILQQFNKNGYESRIVFWFDN